MVDDKSATEQIAEALTALVVIQKTAMEYNERVTQVLEQQTDIAQTQSVITQQLAELQRVTAAIQKSQELTQEDVKALLVWRSKKQAVTDFLMWLLDKLPTIGAIAVVGFWILSQWSTKK